MFPYLLVPPAPPISAITDFLWHATNLLLANLYCLSLSYYLPFVCIKIAWYLGLCVLTLHNVEITDPAASPPSWFPPPPLSAGTMANSKIVIQPAHVTRWPDYWPGYFSILMTGRNRNFCLVHQDMAQVCIVQLTSQDYVTKPLYFQIWKINLYTKFWAS